MSQSDTKTALCPECESDQYYPNPDAPEQYECHACGATFSDPVYRAQEDGARDESPPPTHGLAKKLREMDPDDL